MTSSSTPPAASSPATSAMSSFTSPLYGRGIGPAPAPATTDDPPLLVADRGNTAAGNCVRGHGLTDRLPLQPRSAHGVPRQLVKGWQTELIERWRAMPP